MKKGQFTLIFMVLAASLLLSACTGTGASSSWPGVTVDGNKLYVAYGPYVFAVNAENGSLLWKYPEKANAKVSYYAPPTLTGDGQLIVSDYHNALTSLNPDTGAKLWSFTGKDRFVASASVAGDIILIPSSDRNLYALDKTGQKVWEFKTGNSIWSQPVVSGEIVYQTAMDHKVYAVNLKNGTEIWSTDVGAAVLGSPALDDQGMLYVGTLGNELIALDGSRGTIAWRYKTGKSIWSGIVLKDNVLYFGDLGGSFTALSTETRKPVWQYAANGAIVSQPLLDENRIVFTTETGAAVSLDYSGKLLETKQVADKLYGSPVKSGELMLIPSTLDNIILYAYDASGAQRWSFAPPK